MIGTIVVVILLIILVILVLALFNKIVKSGSENVRALKTLDQVLKKRLELIPNLQEIVKNYSNEEKTTLSDIDDIRDALCKKMTVNDRQKLEDKFSAIFKNIFDSMEKYPDLKESNNFVSLKNELTTIEKDIEVTRRAYNDTTRSYNALIKKSPYKMLAAILGYSRRDFFDVDLVTKEEVAINFEDRRQQQR